MFGHQVSWLFVIALVHLARGADNSTTSTPECATNCLSVKMVESANWFGQGTIDTYCTHEEFLKAYNQCLADNCHNPAHLEAGRAAGITACQNAKTTTTGAAGSGAAGTATGGAAGTAAGTTSGSASPAAGAANNRTALSGPANSPADLPSNSSSSASSHNTGASLIPTSTTSGSTTGNTTSTGPSSKFSSAVGSAAGQAASSGAGQIVLSTRWSVASGVTAIMIYLMV